MCVAKSARLIRGIKDVLERRGWPGRRLVGDDGWSGTTAPKPRGCCVTTPTVTRRSSVVRSRCLRLRWLPVTFAARQLAYLTDRVLIAEGRPQRYGTRFHPVAGQLVPRSIAEADSLDERRAAMDLCPFEEYVDSFRRQFR